ncbi:MAG: conjugal transfer protein TraF [Rickettsiaceae bacterium]|nr:conjugal transfer protein TraF [Rickettsiaceae bacterium]
MIKSYLIALYVILVIPSYSFALNDQSHAKGWYWGFDEEVKEHNEDTDKPKQIITTISPSKVAPSNAKVLDEIKAEVEELKAKAILTPTVDNVASYIKMQNKMVNLANKFSVTWGQTLLQHPELDFTVKNPTNNYAKQVLKEQQRHNTKSAIIEFAKTHGILFFFKGKDELSTLQSKVIQTFVTEHNIAIIPISVDGTSNQYYANSTPDNGRAQKLGITVTPAILALNVQNNKITALGFGVTSEYELEEKIYNFLIKEGTRG